MQPLVVGCGSRGQYRLRRLREPGSPEPATVSAPQRVGRQGQKLRQLRPGRCIALLQQRCDVRVGAQAGPGGIGGGGGIAAAEQIKDVLHIGWVFRYRCQVGGQVQQLTAQAGTRRHR